jgi:hypothetical protein
MNRLSDRSPARALSELGVEVACVPRGRFATCRDAPANVSPPKPSGDCITAARGSRFADHLCRKTLVESTRSPIRARSEALGSAYGYCELTTSRCGPPGSPYPWSCSPSPRTTRPSRGRQMTRLALAAKFRLDPERVEAVLAGRDRLARRSRRAAPNWPTPAWMAHRNLLHREAGRGIATCGSAVQGRPRC